MKAILSLSVFFTMLANFTFAQEKQTETPVAQGGNADIVFEKDLHDFGTMDQGGNGTYEFKFVNKGKEPLIISNAQGSCGCTVPQWPKEPIKPGESAKIKVTYDTKRVGAFTKTVTITSNSKTPSKVLTIKGLINAVSADETMPFKKDNGMMPLEGK